MADFNSPTVVFSNPIGRAPSGILLKAGVFVGKNAAGAIATTGTKKGDLIGLIVGTLTVGGPLIAKIPGTDFEQIITVDDQIQQLVATDLSTYTYWAVIFPKIT